jgi:hypothetical protein
MAVLFPGRFLDVSLDIGLLRESPWLVLGVVLDNFCVNARSRWFKSYRGIEENGPMSFPDLPGVRRSSWFSQAFLE